MKVLFYNLNLENYLLSLEKATVAKIVRTINLLEKFDKQLGSPYSKKITRNLYELRIRGRQEIRIFYCFHHNKAILLHAFVKKSPKTPRREIETALSRIKMLTF